MSFYSLVHRLRINTGAVPDTLVKSVSISHNVDANHVANLSLIKVSDETINLAKPVLPKGSSITMTGNSWKNYKLANPSPVPIFNGERTSSSIALNDISVGYSSTLNRKIKSGEIKELDFCSDNIKKNYFGIQDLSNIDYKKYHDQAKDYNKAFYFDNLTGGDPTRIVLKTKDDLNNINNNISWDFLDTSGISWTSSDDSSKPTVPNIIDIVYTVTWTRMIMLVKGLTYSYIGTGKPADVDSTMTVDGDTVYATASIPAKFSYIQQAFTSKGWSIYNGHLLSNPWISNITEYMKPEKVFHKIDRPDDIYSCNIKGKRIHNQQVSKTFIIRVKNQDSIDRFGAIYKKVTKNKTFPYDNRYENDDLDTSWYVDAFLFNGVDPLVHGYAYVKSLFFSSIDNDINDFVEVAKAEMSAYSEIVYKDNFTFNCTPSGSDSENVASLISTPLPATGDTLFPPGISSPIPSGKLVIFNRTINVDNSTGKSTIVLTGKIADTESSIPDEDKEDEPDEIDVPSDADPDVLEIGSYPLPMTGDWNDENSYNFQSSVILDNYYSGFIDPDSLKDNINPDLTLTNYYNHALYVNKKYNEPTGTPYPQSGVVCTIKSDKVKKAYTKAINIGFYRYPDGEL